MNPPTEERSASFRALVPLAVFGITVFLYGYITFRVLPPSAFIKYSLAAKKYVEGTLPRERLLDFSPLYFSLNVFLLKHFKNPVLVLQQIQILLAGLSALLVYVFLSRFFRPAIVLAGVVAFILNRTLIAYTSILEPEPFLLVWLMASIYFAYRSSRIEHVLAGVFFGFALLTRPNFSPILFVMPLHFLFQQNNRKAAMVSTCLFAAPVLACVIFLWSRNASILGYFSPIVMNPGNAIFEGNNPLSIGQDAVYPALVSEVTSAFPDESDYQHDVFRLVARKSSGKDLTIPEVNSYWIGKASQFLRDHPSHAIQLYCRKLLHCFHNYQWHDLANAYWNEIAIEKSWIPMIPFAVISTLAILGLLVKARDARQLILVYAVFFCQLAFMTVIYVHARHRIAILPIFVFFACAALQFLLERHKRLLLIPPLILLFFLLYLETDYMREENHLWNHLRISSQLRAEAYQLRAGRRWRKASTAAALALAYTPWQYDFGRPTNLPFEKDYASAALHLSRDPQDFSSSFDRGILLLHANKPEEAAVIFQRLVDEGHHFKREQLACSEPRYYLALIAERNNKPATAIPLLQQGLEHSAGDPYLLSFLFALTSKQDYKDQLFRYFDDLDAQFYLGQAFLAAGKPAQAVSSFTYVVQKLPNLRRGYIFLSAALSQAGQIDLAARMYGKAMAMQPDPVLLEQDSIDLFAEKARKNPDNALAVYTYGVVLRQFGHYPEALQTQEAAAKLDPNDSRIRQEIDAIHEMLLTLGK